MICLVSSGACLVLTGGIAFWYIHRLWHSRRAPVRFAIPPSLPAMGTTLLATVNLTVVGLSDSRSNVAYLAISALLFVSQILLLLGVLIYEYVETG